MSGRMSVLAMARMMDAHWVSQLEVFSVSCVFGFLSGWLVVSEWMSEWVSEWMSGRMGVSAMAIMMDSHYVFQLVVFSSYVFGFLTLYLVVSEWMNE